MYKIEYRNPDGTGFNKTDPWISEPVREDHLEAVLEKMRLNGCNVVSVVDIGEGVYFTREEMQMIHVACKDYRAKLLQVIQGFPDEKPDILSGLSARAAEFDRLAGKSQGIWKMQACKFCRLRHPIMVLQEKDFVNKKYFWRL